MLTLLALAKTEPDSSKVRTWTDRSRSFSVDAQFLGLKDGKIHLHKMNGVKIAVPLAKMSRDDIEYVENLTGMTLKDEKSQPDAKKSKSSAALDPGSKSPTNDKPEYDWFQFFLSCDVAVGLCERYAQAFHKDSMDESVLPDVDAGILRNLGLREGDIIKVMRTLDAKFGRQRNKDGDGGLFSGPGGTLRNNTRKGRPAPAVQNSDVVDASAFSKNEKTSTGDEESQSPAPTSPTPPSAPSGKQSSSGGFDDDAWDVKPAKQQPAAPKSQSPAPSASATSPPPASLTGSMKELSLLSQPLQPTPTPAAASTPPAIPTTATSDPTAQAQHAEPPRPGATPSFFSNLPSNSQASPAAGLRQRPAPPQTSPLQGSLVPPPPQRPLSAPLSAQPSGFPAPGLAPQMTGALQSQVAPPGQSLNEMTQARYQQQLQQQQQYAAQMQPNYTGYPMIQGQGLGSFPTGNQGQFMQPMMTGAPTQSPFADANRANTFPALQTQPTGFQGSMNNPQLSFGQPPQGVGINNYLPPALEPQKTGMPHMQPQPTGMGGFNQPGQQGAQQPTQPLQPQQTGPAPPVRFGVAPDAKKLAPQQTGRKANLSQASKYLMLILTISMLSNLTTVFQLHKTPSAFKDLAGNG